MGEPKSRKRKAKTADTEDNETKVLEVPVEEINGNEERKPKTRKDKKMKVLDMSTEETVESEVVETKTKKVKKNKAQEISSEALNKSELNEVKTKKAKKHKLAETPTEEVSENDESKEKSKKAKKHKLAETIAEEGSESDVSKEKTKKAKKNKVADMSSEEISPNDESIEKQKKKNKKNKTASENDVGKEKLKKDKKKKNPNPRDVRHIAVPEEIAAQYPVLTDKVLIGQFTAVNVKTHQRTRIRQGLRKKFKGISGPELPDAIHNYMQTILKAPEVSENDLKRVRILYSMLKTQLLAPGSLDKEEGKNEGNNGETAKVIQGSKSSKPAPNIDLPEETLARYPVLKDGALVEKFMAVSLKNNQKGRIRQILKDSLKGTSDTLLPDVIHNRMQAILKTPELSEPDLRKLRMLYNMLRTALHTEKPSEKKKKKSNEKKKSSEKGEIKKPEEVKEKTGDENKEQKVKGPKRYVVFVGNLPLDISKEKITEHFSDLGDRLKDVRVPKLTEEKKSAIAYLEVADDLSFELALSKNHSMLENKRINVLYTTQQNSKVTKTEAKGKAAKLVAMQKSGKLAGSIPLNKKRSARRNKMKAAQKKVQEAMEGGP